MTSKPTSQPDLKGDIYTRKARGKSAAFAALVKLKERDECGSLPMLLREITVRYAVPDKSIEEDIRLMTDQLGGMIDGDLIIIPQSAKPKIVIQPAEIQKPQEDNQTR